MKKKVCFGKTSLELPMKSLILATSNAGKIQELSALLHPIICIPQTELGISDADETGLTFIENAIIKARHAAEKSGKPSLADDSGLVVPALNGAPGIYSARYAKNGQTPIETLLTEMQHLEGGSRYAYFYCAIVLMKYATDPSPTIATGKLEGYIGHQSVGTKGFGYDPIFVLPERQCTLAELSLTEKNQISHRSNALKGLLELIM